MSHSIQNSLSILFRFFLALGMLASLWACSGSSGVGSAPGGGGLGNFAAGPTQDAGAIAPNDQVLAGEFILVRMQVTPEENNVDGTAKVHLKAQLVDKSGSVFGKNAAGRTVRIYEPTRRQLVDRPIQEGNSFEADLEVLPASFDPVTKKTKGWCYFAVPLGFGGTLFNQPTACALEAPNCFALDDTWFDFLTEDYIEDPCGLLNGPPK